MTATGTGILPTYQRFANGAPITFARKSFRPREKCVVVLVFLTFGFVCFGTFFFLPEFRAGQSTADSVYRVYDQIKRAGPEFLLPPPPPMEESLRVVRHDRDSHMDMDPHVLDDREKLRAKIESDGDLKVLERPDVRRSSSSTQEAKGRAIREEQLGDVLLQEFTNSPYVIRGGEDADRTARERRNKVKEIANPIIGIGNFKLTKLELCDPSFDYPIKLTYKFRKDDSGNQFLGGEGHFKVNFGEDSDFNVTITMKHSKDDEFTPLVSLYDKDTCESMKKYLGPFYNEIQKAAGVKPGTCPVPKGDYVIKDFKLDFSKIAYQAIPEGIIHVEHTIRNVNTKEVLLCLITEGENFKS